MPGARCTRGLVCQTVQKWRTRAYRFSGGSPTSPAQWLYGLLRALPGERACCHRHCAGNSPRNLAPASRRQDHTTSPYAFVALVGRNISVHRNPSNVRDDGQRPSEQDGMARVIALICPSGKAKYFLFRGLTRLLKTRSDLPRLRQGYAGRSRRVVLSHSTVIASHRVARMRAR